MIPERMYKQAEAALVPMCAWPNEAITGRKRVTVKSLAERRAEWEALQPRKHIEPPMSVTRASVFSPVPVTKRRGRPRIARPDVEVLPSGERQPRSGGWRSIMASDRLLPGNVVFWRGPSLLTGEPIMAVAGQHTINAKTGPMVQIWILRSDMTPIEAVKSGGDAAICGDCKLRGDHGKDRPCYVQWFRAPVNIFRSKHLQWTVLKLAEAVAGKQVRVAAYGDPAALPPAVWDIVLARTAGWTGYTHQWRQERFQSLQRLFMASVDTRSEYEEAKALGWRTFRVRHENDAVLSSEVSCPASDEMGHRTTCARCSLCRGLARPAKDVVILAHGQPRSVNVFRRLGERAELVTAPADPAIRLQAPL